MKTIYCRIELILILTILFIAAKADTYHSTTTGGNWHETDTWQEGMIPGALDDVIIVGAAGVIVYNSGHECNNLTVEVGATLRNRTSAARTLDIHGDVINSGTIANSGSWSFTINIEGHIENYGTWNNRSTNLTGTGSHNLTAGNTSTFAGFEFIADAVTGDLTALSDITFYNCRVNLNNRTLVLSVTNGSGFKLIRDDATTNLQNAVIIANNNSIYLENGAYLNNVELSDGVLEGWVRVQDDCDFFGDIIVEDTLSNPTNASAVLDVFGTLTNNGTIMQSSSWALNIYCFGNVINNGTWNNSNLYFGGSVAQNVACLNNHYFSTQNFVDTSATGDSPLVASSKLSFSGCDIDLNWGEFDCHNNEIYLSGGAKMLKATLNNPVIGGKFIAGNYVQLKGEIEIKDTLTCPSGYNTTIIDGNLVNNGRIVNGGYGLTLNITGNVENYGDWITYRTNMTGTESQSISMQSGREFESDQFNDTDITAPLEALTNLSFSNSILDMNGGEMIFNATNGLMLSMSDGQIIDGIYTMNDGIIFMENDAQIRTDVTISDFTIAGNMILYGGNILFEGEVINQDTLQSKSSYFLNFTIDGNLINNGLFMEPSTSYTTVANITGNITNNGEWIRITTHLSGTGSHEISQSPGSEFFGRNFYADAGTGITTALTAINFRDCVVDFNDEALILNGDLSVSEEYIEHANITGNNYQLYMENGAQIRTDVTISDFTIAGNMILYGGNILFEGEVINQDTLQSKSSYFLNFTIDGNLINNGLFMEPSTSYTTVANITGNITNNGEWIRITTHLSGTGSHEISQSPGSEFFGRNFYADAGTGITTALTAINFRDCVVDFNDEALILNGDLSVSEEYLEHANITGSNYQLYMDDNARLSSSTIADIVIAGKVKLTSAVSTFEGEIIVQDTLENYTNNSSQPVFNGNITNNGVIRDYSSSYHLYIHSHGNILNNGEWLNYTINMDGATDQHISCVNNHIFAIENFNDNDITSKIIVDDELHFVKPYIDLNGAELVMPESGKLSVKSIDGNNAHFSHGIITGGEFSYIGNPYAYIQDVTFDPPVKLEGTVKVHTDVLFNNDISVMDTLSNQNSVTSTLNVAGRIVNNGIIRDVTSSYRLSINVAEHVVNNGEWINYRTFLNGTEDQLIYLIAGKEITGQFRFEAMIDDPPYQWQWNGVDLNSTDFTGETSDELIWTVPVSNAYNGYFGCQGATDTTRNILIKSGIIIDPVVQLQGPFNGVDMDTELAEQGMIPLAQPYNVAPWNYAGDETVGSIPTDIVDWVLVELRETSGGPETATEATIVLRRALLLRNDGRVVDPWNQTPELKYDIDLNDNIYMVVWHRNHLGVMTAVPISDGDSPAYFDFSESAAQAYGSTDALIDLGDGIYGLMGGDADYNQQITTQDKMGFWDPNVGMPIGYDAADFTLDGQIDNQDKNQTWVKTLGASTQVPE